MSAKIHLRGPTPYRLRSMAELSQSVLEVSARRLFNGPRRPSWNWFVEVSTQMPKRQMTTAFRMRDVTEVRCYLDSVVISSPAVSEVNIRRQVAYEKFRGRWFSAKNADPRVTVLYFHGGGYSFYPQAYVNFIVLIALAAKFRTFALDYLLSPEHRFPAQLNNALNAYCWLLQNGTDPDNLVVAGDSAGDNLTLALLLAARNAKLPLPALAVVLSPAADFESNHASIVGNQDFDWTDKRTLTQWADWFCEPSQRRNPLVSPLWADLRGLPPIYIQAGRAEILYDSIQAFADHAQNQGGDVVLETWEDMNHDFQLFGPDAPQSAEALRRLGEVINARVRGQEKTEAVSELQL
jgi:monoterpene epsilon-lactone hydrolase